MHQVPTAAGFYHNKVDTSFFTSSKEILLKAACYDADPLIGSFINRTFSIYKKKPYSSDNTNGWPLDHDSSSGRLSLSRAQMSSSSYFLQNLDIKPLWWCPILCFIFQVLCSPWKNSHKEPMAAIWLRCCFYVNRVSRYLHKTPPLQVLYFGQLSQFFLLFFRQVY